MKRKIHTPYSLVVQAAAYLECSHYLIFTFAIIYQGHIPTEEMVDEEYEHWYKTGRVPNHVQDFALDLFTGKCRVDMDLKKTEWQVVRVKRNEPKRLESGSS